jgi:hypothetical protein
MNNRIFGLILISFLAFANLHAMSWPCEDAVLIRNFGSNDNGNPVLGMVFSGDTGILAAEKGEVIFSRGRDDTVSRLPSTLGAWTAIDHGDGLISIYSRYADEPCSITTVQKQESIATMGVSGWSDHNGFYFFVYDRRERCWINPAMIITPQQETTPLQILSVELRNDQEQPVQFRNLTQGRYTIIVNAANSPVQRTALGSILAPQRIVCLVNGAEVGSLNFEAVSARDGMLMVYRNGLVPARQIYSKFPAYETAEVFLNRGQANLEIIVQDITGNSRSFSSRLIIN